MSQGKNTIVHHPEPLLPYPTGHISRAMYRHPLPHPTIRHSIGHSEDDILGLPLQMKPTHKEVYIADTQILPQETEQLRQTMMSAPSEEHRVRAIGNKSEDLVGESIRPHPIGGEQTHIGRSRGGQREESERRGHPNDARDTRDTEHIESLGLRHTYLLEHLASISAHANLSRETAALGIDTQEDRATDTKVCEQREPTGMIVMPMAEDYGRGGLEVHTRSGGIGFEGFGVLASVQKEAGAGAVLMLNINPQGEAMLGAEGRRDVVVYELGYFYHLREDWE